MGNLSNYIKYKSWVRLLQKSDLKNLTFFRKLNGSVDHTAMSLYCFESAVYNIIKNNTVVESEFVKSLFIRNIQPTFWYNDESGVFRINNESISLIPIWHKYIRITKHVKIKDKDSMHFLESLLDRGYMVILQTVFERVKFYQKYDPKFDLSNYYQGEANHANIILFHEADKFYFVDKLPYCVNDNFVSYEDNQSIGVAKKSELVEALNYFMRCYTLDLDVQQLNNKEALNSNILAYIGEIACSYTGTTISKHGYTLYHGILAWEKLIEFCEKGVDTKNYFHTQGWTRYDRICFDIWMLHGSRLILLEYLVQIKKSSAGVYDFSLLINSLVKSINQIKLLEKVLAKRAISRNSQLDNKIADRIRAIIETENSLFERLKDFAKYCI